MEAREEVSEIDVGLEGEHVGDDAHDEAIDSSQHSDTVQTASEQLQQSRATLLTHARTATEDSRSAQASSDDTSDDAQSLPSKQGRSVD